MSNRDTFLEDRRKGIGGSDVAAIMGVSPFGKTPLDIYHSKLMPQEYEDSPQLARGRRAEKYILEEYQEKTGNGFTIVTTPWIHPKYPYLRGNIDAIDMNNKVVIEAKSSVGSPKQWNDEIPIYYKTQVAFYAMITDCKRVDVPVLFDRWQYACFSYYRDPEFEKQILEACLQFWNDHVLKEIPPEPRSTEDARSLFPHSKSTTCQVTETIQESLARLQETLEAKKQLTEFEENLKLEIMKHMKDHETLMEGDQVLASWKSQNRSLFDTARFKADHPALHDQYKKEQTIRVFKLKG